MNMNRPEVSYKEFSIRKKSGRRYIQAPSEELKEFQFSLIPLLKQWEYHPRCAGLDERSIAFNASFHKGKQNVLKMDLHSAFTSTKERIIRRAIAKSDMPDQWKGQVFNLMPWLLFGSKRRYLPTGAPTSPFLLSIALTELDYWITDLLGPNYEFSRYADDITISTDEDISWEEKKSLIGAISEKFLERGFGFSYSKTRWYEKGKSSSIIVTGVNVNVGGLIPRKFKLKFRAELDHHARETDELDSYLQGKMDYIRSVSSEEFNYFQEYFTKRVSKYDRGIVA